MLPKELNMVSMNPCKLSLSILLAKFLIARIPDSRAGGQSPITVLVRDVFKAWMSCPKLLWRNVFLEAIAMKDPSSIQSQFHNFLSWESYLR